VVVAATMVMAPTAPIFVIFTYPTPCTKAVGVALNCGKFAS
jgi:hypothetical protein